MRIRGLSFVLVLACLLLSVAANAATGEKAAKGPAVAENNHIVYYPARGVKSDLVAKAGQNIVFHNGPIITQAHVVFIFWGPSFASGGADNGYATTLQAYRNQFGRTGEYNTITQYTGTNGTVQLTDLGNGTADLFDTTTPPQNVTDAVVQSEVNKYLSNHTFDANAIYEVVIPSTSFSSSGNSTSCGGPNLAYCAYHSWIGSGTNAIKYSIEPWPGCSGCSLSGWSNVQNQQHFVCHETREAVTDPTGQGWWDRSGAEADDKCAWSPTPFFGTGGFGYQYEWSNLNKACIKTR
jgi:hypothetical protein